MKNWKKTFQDSHLQNLPLLGQTADGRVLPEARTSSPPTKHHVLAVNQWQITAKTQHSTQLITFTCNISLHPHYFSSLVFGCFQQVQDILSHDS